MSVRMLTNKEAASWSFKVSSKKNSVKKKMICSMLSISQKVKSLKTMSSFRPSKVWRRSQQRLQKKHPKQMKLWIRLPLSPTSTGHLQTWHQASSSLWKAWVAYTTYTSFPYSISWSSCIVCSMKMQKWKQSRRTNLKRDYMSLPKSSSFRWTKLSAKDCYLNINLCSHYALLRLGSKVMETQTASNYSICY